MNQCSGAPPRVGLVTAFRPSVNPHKGASGFVRHFRIHFSRRHSKDGICGIWLQKLRRTRANARPTPPPSPHPWRRSSPLLNSKLRNGSVAVWLGVACGPVVLVTRGSCERDSGLRLSARLSNSVDIFGTNFQRLLSDEFDVAMSKWCSNCANAKTYKSFFIYKTGVFVLSVLCFI